MTDERLTRALRERSPERLHEALRALLLEGAESWRRDWRDLMVEMAPYHDLARRLELDPAAVFDAAAADAPPDVAEVARRFGGRTDVSEASFKYRIVEDTTGPRYLSRLDAPASGRADR